VNTPGTYTVTVTGANGCTSTASTTITQNITLPVAAIANNPSTTVLNCSTTSIVLTASGGNSYSWSNGTSVVGTSAELTVNTPGSYTVTVTGANGCTSTASTTITQNITAPVAAIANNPSTTVLGCSPTSIVLTASGGNGYSWSNGTSVVGTSAALTVSSPGTYTVTVTGANGCTSTASTTITQDITLPVAAIANNPSTTVLNCSTTSISLTASGGNGYSWSNGTSVVGTSAALTVNTPGTYTVTVTGANGCTSTASTTITQDITAPVAAIANNTSTTVLDCNTTSISLTASGGNGYSWSNGTSVVGTNAALTVSAPGTYTVTVTAANGCVDSENISVTQVQNATPLFTQIPSICIGATINLLNTSLNGITGTWSPAVNNQATTTYTFTPTPGTCANSVNMTVVVHPYPQLTAVNDTICSGNQGSVQTSVNLSGGTYQWIGTSNLLPSLTVSPVTTTNYTVVYNLFGCSDTTTAQIVVKPTPIIQVFNDTICAGSSAQLIATTNLAGGVWNWSNGASNDTIQLNPLVTTNLDVSYTLDNCPSSIMNAIVVVNPIPMITVGNQTICTGAAATLVATAVPQGTYYWGSSAAPGLSSLTITPQQDTTVQVFNLLNGCSSDTVIATVNLLPLPISNFDANFLEGCVPLSITLSAQYTNYDNYEWFVDNQLVSNGAQTTIDFTTQGSYTVGLSTSLNGCTSTTTIPGFITTQNQPIASFEPSLLYFTEESQVVQFNNTSINATSYYWDFGAGENTNVEDPSHEFTDVTNGREITLIATTSFGCVDTAVLFLDYNPGLIYYVPNTFTPDGDQFNQTFLPIFSSGIDLNNYHLQIFNRWGELIFESYDLKEGWDGNTPTNNKSPIGVYTYLIEVKNPDNDGKIQISGHVNLIR
jgi:gliding motility-associated-like protein